MKFFIKIFQLFSIWVNQEKVRLLLKKSYYYVPRVRNSEYILLE